MDIRAGSDNDRQACVELWCAAVEARDGQVDAPAVTARARDKFEHPLVRFAVVDETTAHGTRPVAFALTVDLGDRVLGGRALGDRAGSRAATFELLAVAPGESGRGLGRMLLTDAIETAADLGYSTIELLVRDGNTRAQTLYTAAGFEPFGEPEPHPLGGPPMVRYTHELASLSA
jgi:ribosomal protein S18 acetylase RimI-like enzyme